MVLSFALNFELPCWQGFIAFLQSYLETDSCQEMNVCHDKTLSARVHLLLILKCCNISKWDQIKDTFNACELTLTIIL